MSCRRHRLQTNVNARYLCFSHHSTFLIEIMIIIHYEINRYSHPNARGQWSTWESIQDGQRILQRILQVGGGNRSRRSHWRLDAPSPLLPFGGCSSKPDKILAVRTSKQPLYKSQSSRRLTVNNAFLFIRQRNLCVNLNFNLKFNPRNR